MDRSRKETNIGPWMDERLRALDPDEGWQPDVEAGLFRLRVAGTGVAGRGRRWLWVVAGGAVACLTVMATPVTRAFAQRCVAACVSETGWVRQLLAIKPAAGFAYIAPAHRTMAPDFRLGDASGRPVKLSDFRGKVVLLNFWATWCAPCRTEIPWLVEFQSTHGGQGFQVLGIALDDGGWGAVKPYMEEERVNYPVLLGNDGLTRLYGGVESLPATMIIDKSGRIAATHVGLRRRTEYEGDIDNLLKER